MGPHHIDHADDRVPVYLPRSLWQRLQGHVADTSFGSVDDLVAHALRETLARAEIGQTTGLSAEEEERVKARLKALGYLE